MENFGLEFALSFVLGGADGEVLVECLLERLEFLAFFLEEPDESFSLAKMSDRMAKHLLLQRKNIITLSLLLLPLLIVRGYLLALLSERFDQELVAFEIGVDSVFEVDHSNAISVDCKTSLKTLNVLAQHILFAFEAVALVEQFDLGGLWQGSLLGLQAHVSQLAVDLVCQSLETLHELQVLGLQSVGLLAIGHSAILLAFLDERITFLQPHFRSAFRLSLQKRR